MKVKKRQQRVLMILDSKNIKYDVVDIAEPGNEDAKEFMQSNAKSFGATIGDANPRSPLPPQIFNDEDYCGDYDQFDTANEIDEIEKFLKLPYDSIDKTIISNAELKLGNGEINTHNQNESHDTTKEIIEEHESGGQKDDDNVSKEIKEADEEKNSTEAAQNEVDEKQVEETDKTETNAVEDKQESKETLENGNFDNISETVAEA
ncbi:hypothetical protein RI129_004474 [Pyrocoelia pectoralis]|uniref:Uncharacterized protein n=1 Tax=Pyrocoelia pectoralis TaxID=417401 RepID=A0AAN7ZGT0_9COLE